MNLLNDITETTHASFARTAYSSGGAIAGVALYKVAIIISGVKRFNEN